MKFSNIKVLSLLLSLVLSHYVFGSDHIDGPVTREHGVGDISDLYAFPNSNDNKNLSLVLNAHPLMPHDGHFSSKVNYVFILKRAKFLNNNFSYFSDVKITCSFDDAHSKKAKVTCTSSNGLSARSEIGKVNSSGDFKVYAGMRSDPFYLNAEWVGSTINKGKLIKSNSENTMAKLNVLSIVIDIRTEKLFEGYKEGLIAVAAKSLTKDGSSFRQLDWIGRPEITNFSLVANGKDDVRDRYNKEVPFSSRFQNEQLYQKRLFENILFHYDDQDGVRDWSDKSVSSLVAILLRDHLLIDLSKECLEDSYLDIELSILKKEKHTSCGGRKLSDDIVDRLISLYVTSKLLRLKDGVDVPYRKVLKTFPYLAEPDLSSGAKLKAWFARKFS